MEFLLIAKSENLANCKDHNVTEHDDGASEEPSSPVEKKGGRNKFERRSGVVFKSGSKLCREKEKKARIEVNLLGFVVAKLSLMRVVCKKND